jgi:hypothetical protein
VFKNRALQMKLVSTESPATDDDMSGAFEVCSSEIFNTIIKEHVKNTAKIVVATYAAIKLIQTASEIAINAAPKN